MKYTKLPLDGAVVILNKCASSLWVVSTSLHRCVCICLIPACVCVCARALRVSMHRVKTGNEGMIACFLLSSGADLTDYKRLVYSVPCMQIRTHTIFSMINSG